MILTCPACGTRYVVKDGAIPDGGRQVRCASCKHSWHQDPEPLDLTDDVPDHQAAEHGTSEEFPAPAAMTHPAGEAGGKPPEAQLSDHAHPDMPVGLLEDTQEDDDAHPLPEPGASEVMPTVDQEPLPPEPHAIAAEPLAFPTDAETGVTWRTDERPAEDDFTGYVSADEDEPRRGRGLVGVLLALLLIAALVAGFWFLAPTQWKQRLGIVQTNETPLLVQVDERNRRTLESGNQLLEVSGKVINPTDEPQRVPPLKAQLRSLGQDVVYRWTIPPPAPVLAPGGSASFNSAELNIPAAAACLDVSFAEGKAGPTEPCRASASEGVGQAG
jgi:predicted Zn finger-like uncharacterized protein